jgi:CHAD domain-containing protein
MPRAQDDEPTVGQVLRERLLEQVAALREAERGIRSGDDEGVHDSRMACRRLEAALAMFRPAVDLGVSEPLREELKWLAGSLGAVRDHNVAQERLTALAARDGEAAGLLLAQLRRPDLSPSDDEQRRNDAVLAVLGSSRYVGLLSGLEGFVSEPGGTEGAQRAARPFVRRRIRKEWERLAQRASLVESHPPGHMPDEPLHDVRKAAKRVRYGLEVAQLLWRRKPKRLRRLVQELTDVLGERRDIAITRPYLLQLAAQSQAAGEPTFVHGRLDRQEESRAVELEAQFLRVWSEAQTRRRRWP